MALTPTKKVWGEGPFITLISSNNINGGGPNMFFKETAGTYSTHPHALKTPGGGTVGVSTAFYNNAHHS